MIPLHRKALRPLAFLICGDKGPIYRKGWQLPGFFHDAGLDCPEYEGSTRADWTEARLQEYNQDPDQMTKVLVQLADPHEYVGNTDALREALDKLNHILEVEGLRVIVKGPLAQIQTIEPVTEPGTEELLEQVEGLKYLLLDAEPHSEYE